jgi:hypothetical protein
MCKALDTESVATVNNLAWAHYPVDLWTGFLEHNEFD